MNDDRANSPLNTPARQRRHVQPAAKQQPRPANPHNLRKWMRELGPRDRVPIPPDDADIPF